MEKSVVYAYSFPRSATREAEIAAGRHPRTEYAAFVASSKATLVTPTEAEAEHPRVTAALRNNALPYCAPIPSIVAGDRQYDVVVASGEDIGLPLAIDAYAHGQRTPLYITTHGFLMRFPRVVRLARTLDFVHFLCMSSSLCTLLGERFEIPPERVHNAGWPVDTEFFQPSQEDSEPTLIVSAGTANRDYSTLIRAIDGLPADVRIAADSAWFPKRTDIEDQSLPRRVTVASCETYLGLRALYARASFVVVPLYPADYACGYAVISEAMAMGKAVIATRTNAASDFIVDGETGYHVSPGDSNELREKVRRLLARPDLARRMGQQARNRMVRRFAQESYSRRVASIIASTSP